MKKLSYLLTGVLLSIQCYAQSYQDSIARHRDNYRKEFLLDKNSPLKAEDTAFLRFFNPDEHYSIRANFTLTPDSKPFMIPTHSGKNKTYRRYGILFFTFDNKPYSLEVYQSPDLMQVPQYKDHLFIPFKDLTNYEETYGGGRYLDISTNDIKDNKLILDFNKCYNPYCAYAGGYNCPIPPDANKLNVAINAGEKNFGKEIEH